MKRLRLKEMQLLSLRDRKARRLQFDPRITLLKGPNSTGKSCLIKSIYRCLGASPETTASRWLDSEVKCLLRFEIGDRSFSILQDGTSYTIFDEQMAVMQVSHGTRGLSAFWARECDFGLQLPNAKGDLVTPSPAHYFLPFYIDQDSGWTNPWGSFLRDESTRHARRDLLEYHVGITTNEYYATRARIRKIQDAMREPQSRSATLLRVLRDLDHRLGAVTFNVDVQVYKAEMARLIQECAALKEREDAYRVRFTTLQDRRIELEEQLRLAQQSLAEVGKDYRFVLETLHDDSVTCPTCGASYANSFIQRFSLARDEDQLLDLVRRLREALADVRERIGREEQSLTRTMEESNRVQQVLQQRQGDVTVQDVIENEGKKQVRHVLTEELEGLNADLADKQVRLKGELTQLRRQREKDRRKAILAEYEGLMRKFRTSLNAMDLSDRVLRQLDARIAVTGSEKPRAILTYRWAILHLVHRHSTAAFCPIVIDSPYQQDQDAVGRRHMLMLLRDSFPKDAQMVLGLVDPGDVAFEGRVVELGDRYGMMQASDFETVASEIRPLLGARLAFETQDPGDSDETRAS